jgi:hypothetical protein
VHEALSLSNHSRGYIYIDVTKATLSTPCLFRLGGRHAPPPNIYRGRAWCHAPRGGSWVESVLSSKTIYTQLRLETVGHRWKAVGHRWKAVGNRWNVLVIVAGVGLYLGIHVGGRLG